MAYVKKLKTQEFRFRRGKPPLLGRVDIELTERCNNACLHCLINRPEQDAASRSREMETAFIQNLLRQAADLGCLMVRFTGGEPLLRDDFADLYLYARRLGMWVTIFTNARLITDELADLLSRVPPGRWVEVSVYGMRAESYDASAGAKGSFVEFRRGVDRLRARGIPFVVKGAILPPNKGEWEEFKEWAAGISSIGQLSGESMNFDLRARRDDPAKNERIRKLRLSPKETARILARDPRYFSRMRRFCGKFMGPPGDPLFPCGAGHGTCIDAYGRAQMCMPLRHPDTVYDLRTQLPSPLKYALTEFFPRLREIRATNPEYLRRCARCFLKGFCEQCPGKSWMEHGTLDTPVEYLCAVAHAQARTLGLLKDSENSWDVENGKERIARFTETPE